jgi:hypothetical protein
MNGTTTAYGPGHELTGQDTNNDPFHDPVVLGIGLGLIVITLVILAMGGIYYWGTLYDIPSWSNHSYPPPAVY